MPLTRSGTPARCKAAKLDAEAQATDWTSQAADSQCGVTGSDLQQLIDNSIHGQWMGQKGESYEVQSSPSAGTWSCLRRSRDGVSTKFQFWLHQELVWWGSGTYYFDPLELVRKPQQISWYSAVRGHVAFAWSQCRSQKAASKRRPLPAEPLVQQGSSAQPEVEEPPWLELERRSAALVPEAEQVFRSFFLPQIGLQELPQGFRPPPGLEPDLGLKLFHERWPSQPKHGKNKMSVKMFTKFAKEEADDETSAGSTLGESESDEDCKVMSDGSAVQELQ
mmetsp:Transcript_14898/g.26105  ORF Transcript_14898/g.26105 Transcript_14898/m.26105 type:complete len:278 (-) Transcript_14898:152-985(-)